MKVDKDRLIHQFRFIAFSALLVGVAECFRGAMRSRYGVEAAGSISGISLVPRLFLVVGGALWGGMGIASFHPLRRGAKFMAWLRTTPWHPPMQLPLGDPTPLLQDLPYVITLEIASVTLLRLPIGAATAIFAIGYSVSVLSILKSTGQGVSAFAVLALSPLFAQAWPNPLWCELIAFLALAISWSAIVRGFAKYPWTDDKVAPAIGSLGWPLERVAPVELPQPIRFHWAVAWCALLTWWMYIITRDPSIMRLETFQGLILLLGVSGGLLRLLIYVGNRHAPVSLFGRIITRHFIIPRYDIVFLAPLATVALGAAGPFAVQWVGLDYRPALAITFFLTLLVLFTAGPSRRGFDLTGAYRTSRVLTAAERKAAAEA